MKITTTKPEIKNNNIVIELEGEEIFSYVLLCLGQ
jgi:hypothetical protein